MNSPGPKQNKGFSLVEVSLALAIIGIAFTVIIGMLPVGLRQARAATDTTNESRMLAAMTANVLATEYERIPKLEKEIHYFDGDGGFLEFGGTPESPVGAAELEYETSHVYQAMVVASEQPQVGVSMPYDALRVGRRVHIFYGRITPKLIKGFQEFQSAEATFASETPLPYKMAPVVIAKMDRVKEEHIQ